MLFESSRILEYSEKILGQRSFCRLLIYEISISSANWNVETSRASLIFLMIFMPSQWALLMST